MTSVTKVPIENKRDIAEQIESIIGDNASWDDKCAWLDNLAKELKTETAQDEPKEVRITISIHPGRWGRTYHIFDLNGREIALSEKEAGRMARNILRLTKER